LPVQIGGRRHGPEFEVHPRSACLGSCSLLITLLCILFGGMLQIGALMKLLLQFGLSCLLAQGLFAAHNNGGGTSGSAGHNPVHVHASPRTSGSGRTGGYGYGYYGGYYDPFYDSGEPGYADSGESNPPPLYPFPPPPVIVTQTAHPVIHEYAQAQDYGAPPAEIQEHPVLFLIAFRDNTIRTASTYWVEGGTLHYLDADHQEQQAQLSSVDRNLSAQLNRERHIPFNLQ